MPSGGIMEKEFYTKENYDELKAQLEELQTRKVELKKMYDTAGNEYKKIESEINDLIYNYNGLYDANKKYLEDKSSDVMLLTFAIGLLLFFFNAGFSIYLGATATSEILELFLVSWFMLSSPGIVIGALKLAKKLGNIKEEKLKLSSAYLETLSKMEALDEKRLEKQKECSEAVNKRDRTLRDLKGTNNSVVFKKQEISDFEKTYTNLYLNQEENKKQTNYKTRVLEKN